MGRNSLLVAAILATLVSIVAVLRIDASASARGALGIGLGMTVGLVVLAALRRGGTEADG